MHLHWGLLKKCPQHHLKKASFTFCSWNKEVLTNQSDGMKFDAPLCICYLLWPHTNASLHHLKIKNPEGCLKMLFFSSEHKSTPLSSVLGYNGVYELVFELLTLHFWNNLPVKRALNFFELYHSEVFILKHNLWHVFCVSTTFHHKATPLLIS